MSAHDPNELAERAGVPASYVDRLIELGIVSAGEHGTFSNADVYRVRFVWSSDSPAATMTSASETSARSR